MFLLHLQQYIQEHGLRRNQPVFARRHRPFGTQSLNLLLAAMPGAPSSFLLLVAMPFAPSSVLAPSSDARSP